MPYGNISPYGEYNMPLITICGSQGQGKTTVLASLAELGYNIIPHKTSRIILDEWGVTLNAINKDLKLKREYQDEILVRHQLNNSEAINSDELWFSERSFADIFTYTLLSMGPFNEYSGWLDEYYDKCKAGQKVYDCVIQLGGRVADVEEDGVRSTNQHFTKSVDIILTHYIQDFGTGVLHINTPDHDQRMETIKAYINGLV